MASLLSGPILVVEDDPDILEAVLGFLEMHGYEAATATNGREAVEQLQRTPRPSLILLDMAMPVMGGHRVLTFRKETDGYQAIPVIIISAGMAAMNPRDRALYAANYNVAAFLKKPADPDQLLELIQLYAQRLEGGLLGAPA